MRTLMLLTIVSTLTVPSGGFAQLNPYPPWAGQTFPNFSDPIFRDHPALTAVSPQFRAGVFRHSKRIEHFSYRLEGNPAHGDLAVQHLDPLQGWMALGSLSLGLAHVFDLSVHRDMAGNPLGILVVGIEALGLRSRILYAPWDGAATPVTAVQFGSLVPDSSPGARFLAGNIVGADLYVFEAVSSQVLRYIDGPDTDTLPDGFDASVAPLILAATSPERAGVTGFFRTRQGEVGIEYGLPDRGEVLVIAEHGGALLLESRSPPMAPQGFIVGMPPLAGVRKIRIYTTGLSKIQVRGGVASNDPLTAVIVTDPSEGTHEFTLSRSLLTTDVVQIKAIEAGTATTHLSPHYPVGPAGLYLLSGEPHAWISHSKLEVMGGNFSATTMVQVTDNGAVVPLQFMTMDDTRIIIEQIQLPAGANASRTVTIRITDSAFPGQTLTKSLPLVPKA